MNIIQWNCRGLKNNHEELSLLANTDNPAVICLQETHLDNESKISLKGFQFYNRIDTSHERAAGGSSLLLRENVIHSPIRINTNLQTVAVRITLSFVFTICSIYIPTNYNLEKAEIENLLQQLPEPVIVLGDFNAHNPLWGSVNINSRGKLMETVFSNSDLCLLNDGSDTYLHPGTGSYTANDLTLVSAS
ncbi:MAG: endonuclease/exonuclease/phosphatase family protein, partial [Simkaniaceae bacterium]|nr:endonuclease/exonuclease/phosphatase family protein [Simkaniaceae bacterium]